jgi:hypothetical protein
MDWLDIIDKIGVPGLLAIAGFFGGWVAKGANMIKNLWKFFRDKDDSWLAQLAEKHGEALSKAGNKKYDKWEMIEDPALSGIETYAKHLHIGANKDDKK